MEGAMSLTETAVSQALTTRWLGQVCQIFTELDSSNDLLKEMVHQGTDEDPPAGFVLLTEYQRKGRGRLARRWEAPPGSSLLLSMLFRPNWPAEQANWLTMLVSVAAAAAMSEQTGLDVRLKWPNDIMVHQSGRWHKVSGILQEGSFAENGRLQWAIVGIGMNVNIPEDQLPTGATPATSLMVAAGREIPRLPLLVNFLQQVEDLYELVRNGRSPQQIWQEKLITLGQTVHVTQPQNGKQFTGVAEATNSAGHLLVRDETGMLHTVTAADVTLRQI